MGLIKKILIYMEMKASQLFCTSKSIKNFKKRVLIPLEDFKKKVIFQNFEGVAQKLFLKFKWVWKAQLMSHIHKTLENYLSIIHEQMILRNIRLHIEEVVKFLTISGLE